MRLRLQLLQLRNACIATPRVFFDSLRINAHARYLTLAPALIHTLEAGRNHPGLAVQSRRSLVAQARPGNRHLPLAVHPGHHAFSTHLQLVAGAAVLFGITTADGLIAFYENGRGPLAALPLVAQMIIFLIGEYFILYWSHRLFHGDRLWKYHAVHHSSEGMDLRGTFPPDQSVLRRGAG
jgi:sterol desaturase/sphingolipid hydroxylase (fatty acid hydroxylase superfamily)